MLQHLLLKLNDYSISLKYNEMIYEYPFDKAGICNEKNEF